MNQDIRFTETLDFDNTFIPKNNLLLQADFITAQSNTTESDLHSRDDESQFIDNASMTRPDVDESLLRKVLDDSRMDRSSIMKKGSEDESQIIENIANAKPQEESLLKRVLEENKFEQVMNIKKENENEDSPTAVSDPKFPISAKPHPLDKEIVEFDKFSMNAWAEFQTVLKSSFLAIKTEAQLKQKCTDELKSLTKEYYMLHIKTRENNERIRKKARRENIIEEEILKIVLDDKDNPLGDATLYAKELLSLMHDEPKILATIAKNPANATTLKVLEETLCNSFYGDIISDDAYDSALLRLLSELLEEEFNKANKHIELFLSDNFTNKLCTSYLKRKECKKYIKTILKDPLIAIVRESAPIQLNPDDIQKYIESKQKNKSGMAVCVFKAESFSSKSRSDIMEDYKRKSYSRRSFESLDETEEINTPVLNVRKHNSVNMSAEETKVNVRSFMSTQEPPRSVSYNSKSTQNPDVMRLLDYNLYLLKKYSSFLIQSIFDNLPSMPIGLRTLCRIIYQLAQKRFPDLGPKEYNEILFTFLFRKWISPTFISPVHNDILDDLPSNEVTPNNLMELAKVLQVIFNQHIYPIEDTKSVLNSYIMEIQPSVANYYQELIAVNSEILSQIPLENPPTKLKSKAICISLHELNLLCETIHKQKEQIEAISHDALTLTEKLLYYSREHRIFSNKTDPATNYRLKPAQCYFMFSELIYPPHLITNYMDEFNKIQGFTKSLLEEEKTIYRARHLLKQFLISIQDIKNIMRLTENDNITLNDILEKYQDKLYLYQLNHSNKEHASLDITARFLETTLQELNESYTQNNYYRLYKEMFEVLKQVTEKLDFSISTTKLQLLSGVENLRRSCKLLQEINEKKIKAIEKTSVQDFIRTAHIPCCITSPSILKKIESSVQKKSKKKALETSKVADKGDIVIRDIKGCIHEKTAIKETAGATSTKKKLSSQENAVILKLSHCDTIDEFIQVFGNLAEVKEAMATGKDRYGVNRVIISYYNKIEGEIRFNFKNLTEEKVEIMMNKIENYICKRLYTKIFPLHETEADKRFWRRCKLLEWTNFDHLEVIPRNRCKAMWEHAAKLLNQIDYKVTPLEKLNCILDCSRAVIQVLELASTKESGGGADETLPIMLYVLLLAAPKRMHSNINFITLLRDHQKMQAREGYCFTQVVSVVMTIEALDHTFYKMKEEEFYQTCLEKEILYGFHRKEVSR